MSNQEEREALNISDLNDRGRGILSNAIRFFTRPFKKNEATAEELETLNQSLEEQSIISNSNDIESQTSSTPNAEPEIVHSKASMMIGGVAVFLTAAVAAIPSFFIGAGGAVIAARLINNRGHSLSNLSNVTEGPAQISSTAMMSQYRYSMTPELQAQMELEAAELLRSTSYEEYLGSKEITKNTSEQTNTSASGEVESITVSNSRSKSAFTRSSRQVKHTAASNKVSNVTSFDLQSNSTVSSLPDTEQIANDAVIIHVTSSDLRPSAAPSDTEQTAKFIIESMQSARKQPESADLIMPLRYPHTTPLYTNPSSNEIFNHDEIKFFIKTDDYLSTNYQESPYNVERRKISSFIKPQSSLSSAFCLAATDHEFILSLVTEEVLDLNQPYQYGTKPFKDLYRDLNRRGGVVRARELSGQRTQNRYARNRFLMMLLEGENQEQVPPTSTARPTTISTTPHGELKKRHTELRETNKDAASDCCEPVMYKTVPLGFCSKYINQVVPIKGTTFLKIMDLLDNWTGPKRERFKSLLLQSIDAVYGYIEDLGSVASYYLEGNEIDWDEIIKTVKEFVNKHPRGEAMAEIDLPMSRRPRDTGTITPDRSADDSGFEEENEPSTTFTSQPASQLESFDAIRKRVSPGAYQI